MEQCEINHGRSMRRVSAQTILVGAQALHLGSFPNPFEMLVQQLPLSTHRFRTRTLDSLESGVNGPNASLPYLTSGAYFSEALDSELYRCQWHRVILRGEIPAGARVLVSTFTAEATLTNDQIQLLTEDDWETSQTASELTKGDWDCLVRSGGGRFLWLRLKFFGNSKVTTRIDSVEIEFPRISLRRYLPAYW